MNKPMTNIGTVLVQTKSHYDKLHSYSKRLTTVSVDVLLQNGNLGN